MSIYLDYTADTPPDSRVLECYVRTAQEFFANPNASHASGQAAKQRVSNSLGEISGLLNVKPKELIFTSGASEANNMAVKGLAFANRRRGKHIISSFLEHPSVSGALTFLQEQGWEIDLVHLDEHGWIDLQHLKSLLRDDTVLCTFCAVDSELGIIQPIDKIAEILKDYPNCRLHVDATQVAGKYTFDSVINAADTLCFAPHKFYGLKGCGVLYKKSGVILEPLIHGGASTTLYRSGTPDPASAAACAKAMSLADNEMLSRINTVTEHWHFLRRKLEKYPNIRINTPETSVIPHILNISVNGIKGEEMRRRLNEKDVYVSVKSACSVANTPSRAVLALTHDKKNALSSFRISLSHLTTAEELNTFLEILDTCIKE